MVRRYAYIIIATFIALLSAATAQASCRPGTVPRSAFPGDTACIAAEGVNDARFPLRAPPTRMPPTRMILPGFHLAAPGEVVRPHPVRVYHPRPAPLSAAQVRLGVQHIYPNLGQILLGGGPPTISYQLENYSNSSGAEVNTNQISSTAFYGAPGYVQVSFTTNPGTQYLLDCSLGEDGSYQVGMNFTISGSPQPYVVGTISSFNRHLLIPFNPTPGNAQSAQAVIQFTEMEFNGCVVHLVS